MRSLDEHCRIVNLQIDYFTKRESKFAPDGAYPDKRQHAVMARFREDFESLAEFLQSLKNQEHLKSEMDGFSGNKERSSEPPSAPIEAAPTPQQNKRDLSDLPPELLKELKAGDSTAQTIIEVINDHGGTASIDEILIGIYRKTKVVWTRRNLTNKIHRMDKDGVRAAQRQRGFYTTKPEQVELF